MPPSATFDHHTLARQHTDSHSRSADLFAMYTTREHGQLRLHRLRGLPEISVTDPLASVDQLTALCDRHPSLVRGIFIGAGHTLPHHIVGAALRMPVLRKQGTTTAHATLLLTATTNGEQHTHERTDHMTATYPCSQDDVHITLHDGAHTTYAEANPQEPTVYHRHLADLACALAQLPPVPTGMFS